MKATTTIQRLVIMMQRAYATEPVERRGPIAVDPLYPIGWYLDTGARHWGWPDANEFGAGLQMVGKEPDPPPIIR